MAYVTGGGNRTSDHHNILTRREKGASTLQRARRLTKSVSRTLHYVTKRERKTYRKIEYYWMMRTAQLAIVYHFRHEILTGKHRCLDFGLQRAASIGDLAIEIRTHRVDLVWESLEVDQGTEEDQDDHYTRCRHTSNDHQVRCLLGNENAASPTFEGDHLIFSTGYSDFRPCICSTSGCLVHLQKTIEPDGQHVSPTLILTWCDMVY